ncbi:MAG TPA: RidA family protein [Methylomirabilota bacterium]|nr:RidA family protein [Methylomirabilota bacterium]
MSQVRQSKSPSLTAIVTGGDTGLANATLQPPGWPQPKGYANGIAGEGRIVVTGGVVGWDADGVFPDDFVGQARLTFENIREILREGGAGPEHLVRMTWYVTDIDAYLADPKGLGAAYRAVFGRNFPAMACVQVVRLVEPKAMIEVEATAIVPSGG